MKRALACSIVTLALCLSAVLVNTNAAASNVVHRCGMTGTWLEAHEKWIFSANYVLADNGSDTFSGVFANPAAGATANISGAVLNGTWSIRFVYTDAGHPGWVRLLTGNGAFDKATKNITVNGTEILKKSGVQTGSGTFSMVGKCHAI